MTKIISDQNQLDEKAVSLIKDKICGILKKQNQVVLGVPGGRNVGVIFRLLTQEKQIPWSKVHIFMIDERLVALDNEDSNFRLVKENLIDKLGDQNLPQTNIHPFIYRPNEPDLGLKDYEQDIKQYGGKYDIIILSAGEDGHVAALFPGHHSMRTETEFFLTMDDSPKPPLFRMTSSRSLLLKSQMAIILFQGKSKIRAYEKFQNKEIDIESCPAKLVLEIEDSYLLTDL